MQPLLRTVCSRGKCCGQIRELKLKKGDKLNVKHEKIHLKSGMAHSEQNFGLSTDPKHSDVLQRLADVIEGRLSVAGTVSTSPLSRTPR